MKTFIEKTLITMTLTFALLGVNQPSFAGGPGKRDDFTDLNLKQPADVAILYERIQEAARKVCEKDAAPYQMYRDKAIDECTRATVDATVEDVNFYALTALHKGQSRDDVAGR